MLARDRGFLVVVDDANRPAGVVTDRDLTLKVLAEGRRDDIPVGDVMSRPPTCVNVQESALDAAKRMEMHMCRRLPLVDDSGVVVGVLSLDDLLGEAVDEAKHLSSVLADARRRKRLDLA
jgi:CBS domain-containing protein